MVKRYIPIHGREIDTQQLADGLDWANPSEIERVVLFGEPPNLDRLIQEINDNPEVATLTWNSGYTLLHVAAGDGYESVASLLVDLGADVSAHSNSRGTPLHMAADHSHASIARLLVHHGSDLNAIDPARRSPLHYAVVHDSADIVTQLLAAGANPNVEDRFGLRPLDLAAFTCSPGVARSLLIYGATSPKARTQSYVASLQTGNAGP